MSASGRNSGLLSTGQKHVLIASLVLFFISLGVLIPALGIFIGFIFTITGGVAGGITIGALRRRGGADGAKYGAIVGIVGGCRPRYSASSSGRLRTSSSPPPSPGAGMPLAGS